MLKTGQDNETVVGGRSLVVGKKNQKKYISEQFSEKSVSDGLTNYNDMNEISEAEFLLFFIHKR